MLENCEAELPTNRLKGYLGGNLTKKETYGAQKRGSNILRSLRINTTKNFQFSRQVNFVYSLVEIRSEHMYEDRADEIDRLLIVFEYKTPWQTSLDSNPIFPGSSA